MTESRDSNFKSDATGGERMDSWSDISSYHDRRSRSDRAAMRPGELLGSQAKSPATRIKGLRLLIAGERPEKYQSLAAAFGGLGADVAVADRERRGYDEVLRFMPDAVIAPLTAPGEPGWWFVQRMRRHPILRWTPVLLMRLDAGPDEAESRELLSQIVRRIGQIFSPYWVLFECFESGKPLGDRIEMTGPPGVLRALHKLGLSGLFSVNDTSSVFELYLREGEPFWAGRRGIDGTESRGEEAFMQLMLCDSGRWSFRPLEDLAVSGNLNCSLADNIISTARSVGGLFGPAAQEAARGLRRLHVDVDLLQREMTGLSSAVRLVAKAVADGVGLEQLQHLLIEDLDPMRVERALFELLRGGAVRMFREDFTVERSASEERAVESLSQLLGMLAAEHQPTTVIEGASIDSSPAGSFLTPTPAPKPATAPDEAGAKSWGLYQMFDAGEERMDSEAIEGFSVQGVTRGRPITTREIETQRETERQDETPILSRGRAYQKAVEWFSNNVTTKDNKPITEADFQTQSPEKQPEHAWTAAPTEPEPEPEPSSEPDSEPFDARPTPPVPVDSGAWRAARDRTPQQARRYQPSPFERGRVAPQDSLVPAPRKRALRPGKRGQMWLAISIALLGGGLIIGLVLLFSNADARRSESVERGARSAQENATVDGAYPDNKLP